MSREDNLFEKVEEVTHRLDRAYEWSNLGNKEDPFEELVFIVLSTRTSEEFYRRTFQRVKQLTGTWDRLPELPLEELEEVIDEAGLARKKAQTLQKVAGKLQELVGEVSLDVLTAMETDEAEEFLLDLHGVGPKTAKCILLYSLDREVFPIDTHCVRVMNRLGWLDTEARRFTKAQMNRIEERVPPHLRKTLHVRLVQHGRSTCTNTNPRCEQCPVKDLCRYYQSKQNTQ